MTRWSLCLCALLFVACTDGGPGTESPGGGTGGMGGEGDSGEGGSAGVANPVGGTGGAGTGAGAGGMGGAGGVAGQAGGGAGGMSAGQGGMGGAGGEGGMEMSGEDGGVDDEGYCTVACTGIAPDENVVEACNAIEEMDACTTHETGGFPGSCRWVTPDSEPCLAP